MILWSLLLQWPEGKQRKWNRLCGPIGGHRSRTGFPGVANLARTVLPPALRRVPLSSAITVAAG